MSATSGKRTAIVIPSERPRGPGKPRLVVIAGPELGRVVDLESGDVSIGRDEGATVCIDSDRVSRKHASIQRIGKNYVIADLGSTNGTFVNDSKIRTHKLVEGDLVTLGKIVLKYTESEIEAQYHEQILNLANVDALTGAYNKRYFHDAIGRAVATNERPDALPLSLILFDIDHFKKINDTHGHAAGDHVLGEVAGVVTSQVRAGGTFCRIGGEEFAVILPEKDLVTAAAGAELIRRAIEGTRFVFDGTSIPVTVSLGVAERAGGESAEALYKRSDERLYEAKRSGRNRVSS